MLLQERFTDKFYQSSLKHLLWESLTDKFCQYWEKFGLALHFRLLSADSKLYVQDFLQKKLFIAPFVEHFRTTTLRKFDW